MAEAGVSAVIRLVSRVIGLYVRVLVIRHSEHGLFEGHRAFQGQDRAGKAVSIDSLLDVARPSFCDTSEGTSLISFLGTLYMCRQIFRISCIFKSLLLVLHIYARNFPPCEKPNLPATPLSKCSYT